jgi:hypothetical protein
LCFDGNKVDVFYLHTTGWIVSNPIVYPLICNLKERDHLGDPGVDGRIILSWIFRQWNVGGMDWIELAQDRDRLRALVNAVMNLRVL